MKSSAPKQQESEADRLAKEKMAAEEERLKKLASDRSQLRRAGKVGFESLLSTGFTGRGGLINPVSQDLSKVLGG